MTGKTMFTLQTGSVVVALCLLTACSKPEQALTVTDGWVRLSPPNSMMTAGYGVFTNTGSQPLVLTGFSSAEFGDVTLHYTEDVNGTATMREARDYRLAPGENLTLEPGGYHLMFMQRREPTPEGTPVAVTFRFDSGELSEHAFVVTRR